MMNWEHWNISQSSNPQFLNYRLPTSCLSHTENKYWYLLWVAPVPVLYISLLTNGKQAFFISFAAYLIGRFNWFAYFLSIGTLMHAIILPEMINKFKFIKT